MSSSSVAAAASADKALPLLNFAMAAASAGAFSSRVRTDWPHSITRRTTRARSSGIGSAPVRGEPSSASHDAKPLRVSSASGFAGADGAAAAAAAAATATHRNRRMAEAT